MNEDDETRSVNQWEARERSKQRDDLIDFAAVLLAFVLFVAGTFIAQNWKQ